MAVLEDDEPAAKPRGRVEPELKTVLVDQFGRVVAGGEFTAGGIAPLLTEETSKPLPKVVIPERERESATPPRSPAVSTDEPLPQTSERAETAPTPASPVVRVWLSDIRN